MTKLRLDGLKAALEAKEITAATLGKAGRGLAWRGEARHSEADYKRRLVSEINRLPGGRARRIEDRYGTGILDMIIKLPDRPVVLAEGKLIDGNLFAPTDAQYVEGKKWQAAGVNCLLLGWKHGQLYISHWVQKADCRECFTSDGVYDVTILMEYLL